MIKVLVIGMGQLGQCVRDAYVKYLANNESPAYTVDFATANPKSADVIKLDITNKEEFENICNAGKYSYILNCAAYTNVALAESYDETEQNKCNKINHECLRYVADWCECNSCNLIHISTDFVFGGNDGLYRENSSSYTPLNYYGRSKLKGEEMIAQNMGVNAKYMIIRTSSVYSQYGSNFVLTMLKKFMANEDVEVLIDNVSSPTNANDFAHCLVNHVLHGFASGERKIQNGAYHFSNEGCISWFDFANEILDQYIANGASTTSRVIATDSEEMHRKSEKAGKRPVVRPFSSMLAKDKFKKEGYNIPYWKPSLKEYFISQLHREDYGLSTLN